jgi:hypothetical protein
VHPTHLLVTLAFVIALLPAAPRAAAAECTFEFGFRELHDLIPDVTGDCQHDASYASTDGDGIQPTANGVMIWRKAHNLILFTNGWRTWLLGPCGLQSRANGERLPWERGEACPDGSPPFLGFRQLGPHPCSVEGGTSHGFEGPDAVTDPATVFSGYDLEAAFYLIIRRCTLPEIASVKWDIFDQSGEYVTTTETLIAPDAYRVYGTVTFLRLRLLDQPAAAGLIRLNVSFNGVYLGTYWIRIEDPPLGDVASTGLGQVGIQLLG